MCLVVKRTKPRVARFNIPVYKVLYCMHGVIETPIRYKIVQLQKGLKAEGNLRIIKSIDEDKYLIGEGVIHCFWSKKAMQRFLSFYSFLVRKHFICQKAYIPKGTEFFIGRYSSFGQIGAKEIKFKL